VWGFLFVQDVLHLICWEIFSGKKSTGCHHQYPPAPIFSGKLPEEFDQLIYRNLLGNLCQRIFELVFWANELGIF